MKHLLLFPIYLVFLGVISGQDCYENYRDQGIAAYDDLQFQESINLFEAAKICPDNTIEQVEEVEEWLTRARDGYIDAIIKARDEAQRSEQNALLAQEEANRQATRSEANRLAYLATQELLKNNLVDAMTLAYRALDLVKEDPMPLVEQSFGNTSGRFYATELEGHIAVVDRVSLIEGDGPKILTSSVDGQVKLWNTKGELIGDIASHDGPITALAHSGNGKIIASADQNGQMLLWRESEAPVAIPLTDNSIATALAFAPDGLKFASAHRNGQITIWGTNGNPLKTIDTGTKVIHEIRYDPLGTLLLARGANGKVAVVTNNNSQPVIIDAGSHVYQVFFVPGTRHLLTASSDGKARIWSLQGELIREMTHPGPVYIAKYHSDTGMLATVAIDRKIRLWDTAGLLKHTTTAHSSKITSFSFAGTRPLMASGTSDGNISIWNFEGELVSQFIAHTDMIVKTQFSPGSDLLLTASRDHTVKLWKTDGNLIMTTALFTGPIRNATFSKDGSQFIACSEDHSAAIIRNPIKVFEELQKNPPVVTAEQKAKYGIE